MNNDLIKIGRIISDPEYIGDGINCAFKCIAYCDKEEYSVIAKYLSDVEILKEIICSVLGRTINLPIPEPILLLDKDNKFCFGSIDVGYPNLFHCLNTEDPFYIEFHSVIKNWSDLESATFFDEFIINPDRHSGNLLYNGKDITMIDHGFSMQLNVVTPDYNKEWNNILFNHLLCNFADSSCNHAIDTSKLTNYLNMWCETICEDNFIDKIDKKIPVDSNLKNELLSFLKDRSYFIQDIINNKINPTQMDFVNV
ncbi:hypothetical protein RHO15_09725 [Utexia brackfieldae]|uniref:HipA family kinase n=1 Tax=Utexia brackfieldae TaxID=3074108 RepID=UPI00370DE1D0